MEGFFNNKGMMQVILKWKYHILIIITLAAISGVIFSSPMFIKPRFKSSAIVYPVNIVTYSQESNSENMVQVFESQEIRDQMFEMYDLANHWEIKSTDHLHFDLNQRYEELIDIGKTQYESVSITVQDTDPELACKMVNTIIDLYNKKVAGLHKSKFKEVMVIKEREMLRKKIEIDSLEKMMDNFRIKYNMLDYGVQTEELTKGYMKLIAAGKNPEANPEVASLLKNLKEKGGEFNDVNAKLWIAKDLYNTFRNEYETALEEVEKEITYAQIITHPFVADKKTYPKRSVIILLSVIGALVASLLVIGLIESFKSNQES